MSPSGKVRGAPDDVSPAAESPLHPKAVIKKACISPGGGTVPSSCARAAGTSPRWPAGRPGGRDNPGNAAGSRRVHEHVKGPRRHRPFLAKRRSCALLALGLLGAACRTAPPAATPRPGTDEPHVQGVTEVAFVPDPTVPPLKLPPDEEILRPYPESIAAPVYPADALEAGCGEGVVGLRIVVDPEGSVAEVRDSPVVEGTRGSCARRFREESESAVREWRFVPAQWRKLGPGKDVDGDSIPDYQVVIEMERISSYLDIQIDFQVIGGEGRVRVRI